jgi:hypothetical protein
MSGTHGSSAKLMGFGYDLTGYFRNVKSSGSVAMADKSLLGDTVHGYAVGRQGPGMVAASGLYSDGTGDIQRKLETFKGTVGTMIHLPDGYAAVNKDAVCVQGPLVKHGGNIPYSDMVDTACDVTSKYGLEIGRTMMAFTTPITVAGNGTAVDFTDAFANPSGSAGVVPGAAYLICTAFTGTSNTVTIEHSTDGSTSWTGIGTFTAVTAANTEQRVSLTAGTLKGFLRMVSTGTFSNFTGMVVCCKYAD